MSAATDITEAQAKATRFIGVELIFGLKYTERRINAITMR